MDSESLKIILALKEENILLKRAVVDAVIMLKNRKKHLVMKYDSDDISFLFSEIEDILKDFEAKQKPSGKPDDSNDGSN